MLTHAWCWQAGQRTYDGWSFFTNGRCRLGIDARRSCRAVITESVPHDEHDTVTAPNAADAGSLTGAALNSARLPSLSTGVASGTSTGSGERGRTRSNVVRRGVTPAPPRATSR